MNRPFFNRPFMPRKPQINAFFSYDSDSDYSYSDDHENEKPQIINRNIKLSEERPKSQRCKKDQKQCFVIDNENIDLSRSSAQRSSASFLSDEEIDIEPIKHIPPPSSPRRPIPKPDNKIQKNSQESLKSSEEIQQHSDQSQSDYHRRKKKKKIRSQNAKPPDSQPNTLQLTSRPFAPPRHPNQQQRQINQQRFIQQRQINLQETTQEQQLKRPQQEQQNEQLKQQQQNREQLKQQQNERQNQQQQNNEQLKQQQIRQQQNEKIKQQQLKQQQLEQMKQNEHRQQQLNHQQQQQKQKYEQQKQQQQQNEQMKQNEQKQQQLSQQQRQQYEQMKQQQIEQIKQNEQRKQQLTQQQQQQKQKYEQMKQQKQNEQRQLQQQKQQLNDQSRSKEKEQFPPTSDPLLHTIPASKRYNSSTRQVEKKTQDLGLTDEIVTKRRVSKGTSSIRKFPQPDYHTFSNVTNSDQTQSTTTDNENTKDDLDLVPRKRKKVYKKNKLSVSDVNYVTFYYDSNELPSGELFSGSSECIIHPFPSNNAEKSPVSRNIPAKKKLPPQIPNLPISPIQIKQPPQTSRPIPVPKVYIETDDNPRHIFNRSNSSKHVNRSITDEYDYQKSEYETESDQIYLSMTSGSSIGDCLNKSFMSAAIFNDLNEQYNPTNEVQQQAFRQTSEVNNSTLSFLRVPTLSVFEQNAGIDNNQDDMIKNPEIAFSKMCFNVSLSLTQDNTELIDNNDYGDIRLDGNVLATIPEEEELSIFNDQNIPIKHISRASPKHKSKQLTLEEMKPLKTKVTAPHFKSLEKNILTMIDNDNQNIGYSVKPDIRFIEYNLTTMEQPDPDDITIFEHEGYYCVEKITPEAFLHFKFGSKVTEPNPDHLHIFTWHNLGIRQMDIVNSLYELADKIEGNESFIPQIKSVIQYLFIWIYLFAIDFYGNTEIVSSLRNVLNIILDKSSSINNHSSLVSKDICFLKACFNSLSTKKSSPEKYIIPLTQPSKSSNISYKSIRLIDLKLEPSILVQHFTYIELELLKKIDRSEIIKQVSLNFPNKESKEKALPNYSKYFLRFNNTAVFIALSILVEGSRNRAKKIEYWIKVMEEARKFRNYFLLYEIDAGLSCFPINRLEKSWKKVSKKFIALFNSLHAITNPTSKAIIAYKKEVNKTPEFTNPYIGPFLTELKYLFECKKVMLQLPNGKEGYNMKFQRASCNVLESIFQEWGTKIDFNIDMFLLEQCIKLEGKELKTEDLMPFSIRFEPPNST